MNHFRAAEIADKNGQPTGLYRYVSSNSRGGTHAIGYCCSDPENNGEHCPGHPTPEEACAHKKAYDLDKTLRFSGSDNDETARSQYRCEAPDCQTFTAGSAWVGPYWHASLCDEHRNRETVEQIYDVGEAWSS